MKTLSPSVFLPSLSRMLLVAAAPLLFSTGAWAHITIGVHIGIPGGFYVAPPVYVAPPLYVAPPVYMAPPVYVAPPVYIPPPVYVLPRRVAPVVPVRPLPYPALDSAKFEKNIRG